MIPVTANDVNFDQDLEAAAQNVVHTMRRVESGGRWTSDPDYGVASSLQYSPDTWDQHSREYTKATDGIGLPLPLTPENENKVAVWKAKDWLSAGYTPSQIASIWNSGHPDWEGRIGTNKQGNPYDVPNHVAKFETAYYGKIQSPDLLQRFGQAVKGLVSPSEAQAADIPRQSTLFAVDPGPESDYFEIHLPGTAARVRRQSPSGVNISAWMAWSKDEPLPEGISVIQKPKSVLPGDVTSFPPAETPEANQAQPQAPIPFPTSAEEAFKPVDESQIDWFTTGMTGTGEAPPAPAADTWLSDQWRIMKNYYAQTGVAWNTGMADLTDLFVRSGDLIHRATGGIMPRAVHFEQLSKEFNAGAQYYNSMIKGTSATEEVVGAVVGGALPGAVKFGLGIPAAAVDGYHKGGYKGAVEEIVKRYAWGKILQASAILNRPTRVGALSTAAFLEAKAEGRSTSEAAKSAAVMGIMSVPGGGRKSIGQAVKDFKETVPDVFKSPEALAASPEMAKMVALAEYHMGIAGEDYPAAIADLKLSTSEEAKAAARYLEAKQTGEVLSDLLRSEKGYIDIVGIWDGILRATVPTMRGPEAARAGRIISENESRMCRGMDQFLKRMEKANSKFMRMTNAESLDFMQRMDTGMPQASPELQAVADILKGMFYQRVGQIQALGTGALRQVRANYFPHIWKKAPAEAGEPVAGTSIEGGKSFIKHRVWKDVMAGISHGAEPISYNPLDLVALKLYEMDRYIFAQKSFKVLIASGDMKLVRANERAPQGFEKIDDRYGTVWHQITDPQGKALGWSIERYFVAKDPVAQVINNYLSDSLYKNKYVGSAFGVYMGAANTLNSFQLGMFSMFHAGFTSVESVISNAALGIRQASQGRVTDSIRSFFKSPFGFISNPIEGRRILQEWYYPGSQNAVVAKIVEAIHLGGGQFGMPKEFTTSHIKKMVEEWNAGGLTGKVKAVTRSPAALCEASTLPVLKWLVPAQKAGLFGLMAQDWMSTHPNATYEQTSKAMRQIWNRVDSRLGQVVYSRIFAHNAVRNVTQALMRAPGWKGGSIAEFGGSVKDLGEQFVNLSKGEGFEMSDRMAYVLATALVSAVMNGALTAGFTGEKPQGMDFLAFRVGHKDKFGNDVRFLSPTYLKDLYAYARKGFIAPIISATNPLLNLAAETYQGKDFYGVETRHPGDRIDQQALQEVRHALSAFMPFWVRGALKASENYGSTRTEVAMPLAGFTPASSEYTKSKAQLLADDLLRRLAPQGEKTQAEYEKMKVKSDLKARVRAGDPDVEAELRKAIDQGVLQAGEARRIQKAGRTTPFQDQVGFLATKSIDAAMKVYEAATDAEKEQIRPLLQKRIRGSKSLSLTQKAKFFEGMK